MNKQGSVKSIFAIGDIHGCARELQLLLTQLPLVPESTLVFLGDYIDRGNYSREVIDTIISLRKQYNVITLKGNHEAMLLDFMNDPKSHGGIMFIMNGGASTLANYSDEEGNYLFPKEHVNFFKSLKTFATTSDYYFVHAGVPLIPLDKIDIREHEETMLWIRDSFLKSDFNWGKVIVHGHTVVEDPEVKLNRINLDTGCVFHGKLTAVELPACKFYSVSNETKNEPRVFLREKGSHRVATRFDGEISVFLYKDDQTIEFKTQNFNEFGLLIHPVDEAVKLVQGEKIKGWVGNDNHLQIQFEGTVMRIEARGEAALYGVKLDHVYPPDKSS